MQTHSQSHQAPRHRGKQPVLKPRLPLTFEHQQIPKHPLNPLNITTPAPRVLAMATTSTIIPRYLSIPALPCQTYHRHETSL